GGTRAERLRGGGFIRTRLRRGRPGGLVRATRDQRPQQGGGGYDGADPDRLHPRVEQGLLPNSGARLQRPGRAQRFEPQCDDLLEFRQASRELLAFGLRPGFLELPPQRGTAMEELDLGRNHAGVLEDAEREAQLAGRLRPALDLGKRLAMAGKAAQLPGATHGLELLADPLVEGAQLRLAPPPPLLGRRPDPVVRAGPGRPVAVERAERHVRLSAARTDWRVRPRRRRSWCSWSPGNPGSPRCRSPGRCRNASGRRRA